MIRVTDMSCGGNRFRIPSKIWPTLQISGQPPRNISICLMEDTRTVSLALVDNWFWRSRDSWNRKENIPVYPLLNPARKVDVIIAVDSSNFGSIGESGRASCELILIRLSRIPEWKLSNGNEQTRNHWRQGSKAIPSLISLPQINSYTKDSKTKRPFSDVTKLDFELISRLSSFIFRIMALTLE